MRDERAHGIRGRAVVRAEVVVEHRVDALVHVPVEPRGDVEIEVLDGEFVISQGGFLALGVGVDLDLLAERDAPQIPEITGDLPRVIHRTTALIGPRIGAGIPGDIDAGGQPVEPLRPEVTPLVPDALVPEFLPVTRLDEGEIRAQPPDRLRRQRVGAVGKRAHEPIGVALVHLEGDAVEVTPDMIGHAPLPSPGGRELGHPDGIVRGESAIPVHEVDVVHRLTEVIEHRPHVLHLLLEEQRRKQIGHTVLLERRVARAAPQQVHPGVGPLHLLPLDDELHAVADLWEPHELRTVIEAQPEVPQGLVADAGVFGVVDEASHGEVGCDRAPDVGHRDGVPGRNHLPDLARCEPAAPESSQELVHGVEGACVVLVPDIECGVITEVEVARRVPEHVARDLVPVAIHPRRLVGRAAASPWLDRHEVPVRAEECKPLRARVHAKGAVCEPVGGKAERIGVPARADEDRRPARLAIRDDRQRGTCHLSQTALQLLGRQSRHAGRLVGDHDRGARHATLDDEGLGSRRCRGDESDEDRDRASRQERMWARSPRALTVLQHSPTSNDRGSHPGRSQSALRPHSAPPPPRRLPLPPADRDHGKGQATHRSDKPHHAALGRHHPRHHHGEPDEADEHDPALPHGRQSPAPPVAFGGEPVSRPVVRFRVRGGYVHDAYLASSLMTTPSITTPVQWVVYSKGSPS